MTLEQDALLEVARILDRLKIPHMVTGSVASSFHGRPRLTHDADIVIDPSPDQLEAFVASLVETGFYVDPGRARDALRRRKQFNAIETSSAFKVDLIAAQDQKGTHDRHQTGPPRRSTQTKVLSISPGLS